MATSDNFVINAMVAVKIGDQSIGQVINVNNISEIPLALHDALTFLESKLLVLALDNTSATKLHEDLKLRKERLEERLKNEKDTN